MKKDWYREASAKNPLDKDLKRPVIISELWSEKKLEDIIRYAYRKFFFRPSYVYDRMKNIVSSPARIWTMAKTAISLLKWFFLKK